MADDRLELKLEPAGDDPPINSAAFQTSMVPIGAALAAAGVRYSQRAMAFDAAEAIGFALPEYVIQIGQALGPTLGVVLVAWLQGRAGRKVRLKVGDIEAEARTTEELERLLERAARLKEPPPVTDDAP